MSTRLIKIYTNKLKVTKRYISNISPEAFLGPICIKSDKVVASPMSSTVITFYNWLEGFDSAMGQNFQFGIENPVVRSLKSTIVL